MHDPRTVGVFAPGIRFEPTGDNSRIAATRK